MRYTSRCILYFTLLCIPYTTEWHCCQKVASEPYAFQFAEQYTVTDGIEGLLEIDVCYSYR